MCAHIDHFNPTVSELSSRESIFSTQQPKYIIEEELHSIVHCALINDSSIRQCAAIAIIVQWHCTLILQIAACAAKHHIFSTAHSSTALCNLSIADFAVFRILHSLVVNQNARWVYRSLQKITLCDRTNASR